MSNLVRVPKTTVKLIQYAVSELLENNYRHYYWRSWHSDLLRDTFVPLRELQNLILDLEQSAAKHHSDREHDLRKTSYESEDFPICIQTIDIAPIYKEAVSLEAARYIVAHEEIPNLLDFLQIPKSREGIDVENHNFGYHFHYGKIKSNELVRSNILLTFNPSYDLPKTKSKPKIEVKRALYSEYHGEGHTKHIDVATIGDNKRLPIYLVCLDAAQKRGFENFKRLKAEAQIFYLPPD